jgi:hypothetical protein
MDCIALLMYVETRPSSPVSPGWIHFQIDLESPQYQAYPAERPRSEFTKLAMYYIQIYLLVLAADPKPKLLL